MQLTLSARLDQPMPANPHPVFRDEAPRTILVHQEFIDWFYSKDSDQHYVKRARFSLNKLLSHGYVTGSKSLVGPGKGWLRAALGGGNGFSKYMWYATHASAMGQELGLQSHEIAVRLVRPHDDNGLSLNPGNRDDYEILTPSDIQSIDENETGYTEQQISIALNVQGEVQTVRGYPGSGKTTSLLLAGEHAASGKVLYITYSEKLARDAIEYFASFRPNDVDIEVLTFNTLLSVLENSEREDFSRTSNVQEAQNFLDALKKTKSFTSLIRKSQTTIAWNKSPDELYAEIHAHCVGRALPIDFRDTSATDNLALDSKDYLDALDSIQMPFSNDVAKIIDAAHEKDLFPKHFPHLARARSLIRDINEPPPTRLKGANCILVDEIQDLTYIEAFLLLNVVARIAANEGRMPRLVLAGDESQTVRPTDFEWGWLKDLVTLVFGKDVKITDIALSQNMRSPLQIAKFVEATRQQYSKFEKGDRPSGMTYTEVNDARIGRVRYCALETDEQFKSVLELFDQLPNSRLVYPGFSIPDSLVDDDELKSVIYTSEEVKGLDYDLVGVIDAGQRIDDLDGLIDDGLENFGRTLADQYRVAASRASETLILFDRNGNDHASQIRDMCKGRAEIDLEIDDPDLITLELQGDYEPEELIQNLIDDVKNTIDNQPERAILRSRSIVRQFEKLAHAGPVSDDLKFQVYRTRGVAALVGLLRPNELTHVDVVELEKEAKSLLQKADLGNSYIAIRDLATCTKSWADKTRLSILNQACEQLDTIQVELPEVFRMYEESLLRWLSQLETKDLPAEIGKANEALNVATNLVSALEVRHEYLSSLIDQVRTAWSDQAMSTSRINDALHLLNGMRERDNERLASCHEKLKNYRDAANNWELSGDWEKAIHCYRQIPDLNKAILLAKSHNSPALDSLKWLFDVRGEFRNRLNSEPIGQVDLTEGEFQMLKSWAESSQRPGVGVKGGIQDDPEYNDIVHNEQGDHEPF
jgi:hypothetical protein